MNNKDIAYKVSEKYKKSIIPTEEECLAYSSAMEAIEMKEKQLIDKACEWLKDIMYFDEYGLTHKKSTMEDFINDFKKAMEE